jgi:hypothetical protein
MKRCIIITYDVRANEIMRGWAGEAEKKILLSKSEKTQQFDHVAFGSTNMVKLTILPLGVPI